LKIYVDSEKLFRLIPFKNSPFSTEKKVIRKEHNYFYTQIINKIIISNNYKIQCFSSQQLSATQPVVSKSTWHRHKQGQTKIKQNSPKIKSFKWLVTNQIPSPFSRFSRKKFRTKSKTKLNNKRTRIKMKRTISRMRTVPTMKKEQKSQKSFTKNSSLLMPVNPKE
jgi:hypothetical protein